MSISVSIRFDTLPETKPDLIECMLGIPHDGYNPKPLLAVWDHD